MGWGFLRWVCMAIAKDGLVGLYFGLHGLGISSLGLHGNSQGWLGWALLWFAWVGFVFVGFAYVTALEHL
jgi:hypothetical protein